MKKIKKNYEGFEYPENSNPELRKKFKRIVYYYRIVTYLRLISLLLIIFFVIAAPIIISVHIGTEIFPTPGWGRLLSLLFGIVLVPLLGYIVFRSQFFKKLKKDRKVNCPFCNVALGNVEIERVSYLVCEKCGVRGIVSVDFDSD